MSIMKHQSVLVVGGGGFLGRHLTVRLLAEGFSVRCFDRVKPTWLPRAVEFYEGDFTASHILSPAVEGVDVVFHLASTTLPKSSNEDPQFDVMSNLAGTVSLLDLAVKNKVARLVFTSSGGTVYGVPTGIPISEQHPTNPMCSYGIVKLAIEKYLRLYHSLHGLSCCSLRLANPYGEYQRVDSGQGAIAVFCHQALRGETVKVWGDGEVIRDFFYVGDAVEAMMLAMRSDCAGIELNVGSGDGASINQIIGHIEAVLEQDVARQYLPGRPFDIPKVYLDISCARHVLGWAPSMPLHEGVKRVIDWMRGGDNAACS